MADDKYPQMKIRDAYFGNEGGKCFVNADVQLNLGDRGGNMVVEVGIDYSDDETVGELKKKILNAAFDHLAQASKLDRGDAEKMLEEGSKSYMDRPFEFDVEAAISPEDER